MPALQSWDNLAEAYQARFMDLDLYNDTYDTFLKLIPEPEARILEIGCGPGNITRYLLAQRPSLEIEATDLSPNMVMLARANNPTARCRVLDARDIAQLPGKYHGVMCGFIMPYLSKEACGKLFADSAGLLLPDGVAYFSCIEGDYARSGFETDSSGTHQMQVYYHEEPYLQQFLHEAHFNEVTVTRKHFTRHDGSQSVHLILIARKG